VLPVYLSPSTVTSASISFKDNDGIKRDVLLSDFQGFGTPDKTIKELAPTERVRRFLELHDRIKDLAALVPPTALATVTSKSPQVPRSSEEAVMGDVKYYLYVSDAKINMLFAQIPTRLAKRLSAELEVDFQIISLKPKSATQHDTRYSKLKVVERYLRCHENVGDVDRPGSYFGGSLALVYTIVGPTAVFFGKGTNTMVGLTGSAHHVTGNAGTPAVVSVDSISHLALPAVAGTLAKVSGEPESDPGKFAMDPASALAFVLSQTMGRRPQRVDFLASTMYQEDVPQKDWAVAYKSEVAGISHVLLGSPLYVALSGTAGRGRKRYSTR
jgi:hypothetical protein